MNEGAQDRERLPGVALLLANLRTGGAERNAVDLACHLPAQGWRPVVLVADETGPLEAVLREHGIAVEFLGAERHRPRWSLGFWGNLARTLRRIRSACRRHECQVLHSFLFWESALAVPAARLPGGPRLAVVQSRLNEGRFKDARPFYQRIENLLNLGTDAFVANSQVVAEDARRREKHLGKKLRVISNGIELEAFRSAEPLAVAELFPQLADAEPLAVCVANFKRQKRHDVLLRAVALARERGATGLKVLLVGRDLGERPGAERLARELGLEGAVAFAGELPSAAGALAAAEVFVLTSDFEGLPTATIEAMAAGKACVVTPAGGTPELIQDGETGLLVPMEDPEGAAEALVRVSRDGELRRRLGEAARRFAWERFAIDRFAEAHSALYEAVSKGQTPLSGEGGETVL